MAGIVYEGVRNTADNPGQLFAGQRFWFSGAVPQRKWFVENAIANGAEIVQLEKEADVCFVDHARKNAPVGTHSYKYIEHSIRNGKLENLEDHRVGLTQATQRPVGSRVTAAKVTRAKFTEEDDQLLWNFVKPFENAGGASGGNEIYKQLEEAHGTGRHTYQSWRDRWLKHVRYQKREITQPVDIFANVANEVVAEAEASSSKSPTRRRPHLAASNTPHAATAAGERATPKTRISKPQQSPPPSPGQALAGPGLAPQTRVTPKRQPVVDFRTLQYRQALERKLGIVRSPGATRTRTRRESPQQDPSSARTSQMSVEEFSNGEYGLLIEAAKHIIQVGEGEEDGSWDLMNEKYPEHSAKSWREFWLEKVKPDYLKELQANKRQKPQNKVAQSEVPVGASEGEVANHEEYEPGPSEDQEGLSGDDMIQVRHQTSHQISQGPLGSASPNEESDEGLFVSQRSPTPRRRKTPVKPVTSRLPRESVYLCKWLGCEERFISRTFLGRHIAKAHKPTGLEIIARGGFACFWSDCAEAGEDEDGDEMLLIVPSRQAWVKHYIDDHLKHTEPMHEAAADKIVSDMRKLVRDKNSSLGAGEEASIEIDSGHSEGSGSFVPPERHQEHNGGSEAAEEEDDEVEDESEDEDDDDDDEERESQNESEEFEESEEVSSAASTPAMDLELSSGDDHRDSPTRRRGGRLREIGRPIRMGDAAFDYVDKAVGSSPPLLPQNSPNMIRNRSLRLLSPVVANEARKRSPGKGNSQESSKGNSQESAEIKETAPQQLDTASSLRKRTRDSELQVIQREQTHLSRKEEYERVHKRQKQRHNHNQSLEIPSTPEARTILGELHDNEEDASSMLNGSPTPRPRSRHATFAPKSTPRFDATLDDDDHNDCEHTSPLHLTMLSDLEGASSSPIPSNSTHQDDLSSEADIEFETAQQSPTANLWGTAPYTPEQEEGVLEDATEDEEDQEEVYETAAWERQAMASTKGKGRAEPDLSSSDEDLDEDLVFTGARERWSGEPEQSMNDDFHHSEERSIPTSYQLPRLDEDDVDLDDSEDEEDEEEDTNDETPHLNDHENDHIDEEDNEDNETSTSVSSSTGSISSPQRWVRRLQERNPTLDQPALLLALHATSAADKPLIWQVYRHLVDGKDHDSSSSIAAVAAALPPFRKGCWTDEDDEALRGGERGEVARVSAKHGLVGVRRRMEWLGLA